MAWILIGLIALAIVIVALVAAKKNATARTATADCPYVKQATLLTDAERSFLGVLEQAVGERYRVYAQVRLADLISVKPGTEKSKRTSAQNRINQKHADFVLCEPATLAIVCAVELDDSSHQREKRKVRDAFVEQACAAAGLPLARFPAKGAYAIQEVRSAILTLLGLSNEGVQVSGPSPEKSVQLQTVITQVAPPCPKCASETVLRTVKSGARAGSKLWGCKSYPACKGFIPLTDNSVGADTQPTVS
jgi:very-short-patch-repair endonuclease